MLTVESESEFTLHKGWIRRLITMPRQSFVALDLDPMKLVSIAKDFSKAPRGRTSRDGPFNGEAFRKKFLEPAIDAGQSVVVDVGGIPSLPSSFLEEAFGGLYRRGRRNPYLIKSLIKFESTDARSRPYVDLIQRYMDEASRRGRA